MSMLITSPLNIALRIVTPSDWHFILEVRNEVDVRNASFTTEVIGEEAHIEYMKKLATMENVYQRIIKYGDKNVGYIKVIDDEVSYMLKKQYRGKGLMNASFNILFEELRKLGRTKSKACIKSNNSSSLRFIEKLGYRLYETKYDDENHRYYIFQRDLA